MCADCIGAGSVSMGVVPPGRAISWLSTMDTGSASRPAVPTVGGGCGLELAAMVAVAPSLPAGGYMGEGLLPIPDKLVKKITNLEFVELREMLPEVWLREEKEAATRNVLVLPRRKTAQITDILVWVQLFTGYVSVLSTKYPQAVVPELMAYTATIVKCSKNYDDSAWARYDMLYRKQMAKLKDLKWSMLNPILFSMCFAGKARLGACICCLSDLHSSADCSENPANSGWELSRSGDSSRSAPGAVQVREKSNKNQAVRICYLYNRKGKDECIYNPCKFAHICSGCKGNHPRSQCSGGTSAGVKRPRLN